MRQITWCTWTFHLNKFLTFVLFTQFFQWFFFRLHVYKEIQLSLPKNHSDYMLWNSSSFFSRVSKMYKYENEFCTASKRIFNIYARFHCTKVDKLQFLVKLMLFLNIHAHVRVPNGDETFWSLHFFFAWLFVFVFGFSFYVCGDWCIMRFMPDVHENIIINETMWITLKMLMWLCWPPLMSDGFVFFGGFLYCSFLSNRTLTAVAFADIDIRHCYCCSISILFSGFIHKFVILIKIKSFFFFVSFDFVFHLCTSKTFRLYNNCRWNVEHHTRTNEQKWNNIK